MLIHIPSSVAILHWASVAAALALVACGIGDEAGAEEVGRRLAEDGLVPGNDGRTRGALADEYARMDPEKDGWRTESVSESAGAVLKKLAKALAQGDLDTASGWCVPGATFPPLRPPHPVAIYDDGQIQILRAPVPWDEGMPGPFEAVWQDFAVPLEGVGETHVAFKLFKIQIQAGSRTATTRVVVSTWGVSAAAGGAAQNAEWEIGWQLPDAAGGVPRITAIRPLGYEEVRLEAGSTGSRDGALFADVTRGVLAQTSPGYQNLLLPGLDHWGDRLDNQLGLQTVGYNGLALGDADGDGLDDLFVCQPAGLPNQLFLRQPDGSFTDASAASQTDYLEQSHGALFADLDNDGDQDLVVLAGTSALVLENAGDATFVLRQTIGLPGSPFSVAAADPDGDGDLDLYICNYGDPWGALGDLSHRFPFPYHDANNGAPNVFLRNEGGLRFIDATDRVGFGQNNTRWSLAAAWEDFDNDGDQDLYVANDFGRNCLYENDGSGHFTEIAARAGVEDISPGMSVTWGDYDRDGHMDIYVSNMFSGAGNRITFQSQFLEGADAETRKHFQRFARGNALFRNNGDGTFSDRSLDEKVSLGRWAWASHFADFNNDGWEDIVVGNGFLTQEDPDDL
ncbi:hypothetical protein BH23VER1_BH23VER1_03860 [soil metagenome]